MREKLARSLERIWSFAVGTDFKRTDYILAGLVTAIALVIYIYNEGGGRSTGLRFIENVEARSLDARFNLRGTRPHDENIVIVGLDEATLQRVGAYPIP